MTLTTWSSEFPTSWGYIVRHLPPKTKQKQTTKKQTTKNPQDKNKHKELIPTAKMHCLVEEHTEHSCLSIQCAWFFWNQFYYFTISSEQESN